jgi:hypothetical protein
LAALDGVSSPSWWRSPSRGRKLCTNPETVKPKISGHQVIHTIAALCLRPDVIQCRDVVIVADGL